MTNDKNRSSFKTREESNDDLQTLNAMIPILSTLLKKEFDIYGGTTNLTDSLAKILDEIGGATNIVLARLQENRQDEENENG